MFSSVKGNFIFLKIFLWLLFRGSVARKRRNCLIGRKEVVDFHKGKNPSPTKCGDSLESPHSVGEPELDKERRR